MRRQLIGSYTNNLITKCSLHNTIASILVYSNLWCQFFTETILYSLNISCYVGVYLHVYWKETWAMRDVILQTDTLRRKRYIILGQSYQSNESSKDIDHLLLHCNFVSQLQTGSLCSLGSPKDQPKKKMGATWRTTPLYHF